MPGRVETGGVGAASANFQVPGSPSFPIYVERLGAGGMELGLLVASYAVMRLICLFTLAIVILAPSVSALTSRLTSLEQGLTMGLSNVAQSLGRIAGPLLGGIAFDGGRFNMHPTVFVAKFRTLAGKGAARLLIQSIRTFGGEIGRLPGAGQ